jgi:hypothetical protein
VCFRLVLSSEVQVNIRLLVTFKAKEYFEGYVMPILLEFCTTLGAVFVRKVGT